MGYPVVFLKIGKIVQNYKTLTHSKERTRKVPLGREYEYAALRHLSVS